MKQNPPQQYSSVNGTIQGTIDGKNTVFTLPRLQAALVFRNGQLMTFTVDCVYTNGIIVFLPGQVPVPGDVITALA